MADISIRIPDCEEDGEGERGERGERGKRGHRGHDGHDGATGSTGPTGTTGATGTSGVAPTIAAATLDAAGVFLGNHPGFSAVVHSGVGLYALTLTNPPSNLFNLVVVATLASLIGQISWEVIAVNQILIGTFDSAGAAADRNFSVVAYDVT
jgi:hypothetical protein